MNTTSIFRQAFVWFPRFRATAVSVLAVTSFAAATLALEPPPGGAYIDETTALGQDALLHYDSSSAGQNTALGFEALYETTTGEENTAVGNRALYGNTTGVSNVAVGFSAVGNNTTGGSNVGVGSGAMVSNTTANANTAVGTNALQSNTTSGSNTAIGSNAMTFSTGPYNTAVGAGAMAFNNGMRNVAVGDGVMSMGGAGSNNIAIGYGAGYTLTGNNNIVIGYNAASNLIDATSSNNIEIGTLGTSRDANVIRLGDPAVQKKAFIARVNHSTIGNGVAVMVNNQGELGVATSSARYKRDIKPMEKSSEAILSLQPVTFRYQQDLDSSGTPQFGLVAEEVAKVDPNLVAKDEAGRPYTVRYEAVNAMLLNEFLKEHGKVEEQGETIRKLQSALEAQAALIQKVSAQVQAAQNMPRLVSTKE